MPLSDLEESRRLSTSMGLRNFRRKSEHELDGLPEDDLVAYLVAARRAGDVDASGLSVAMLVWGFMGNVRHRVALKVPKDRTEEVAESVLLSALSSDFDGSSVGEFRNWIGVIVKRRIADYHRNPKSDVRLVALPTEHLGDDEIWGEEPSVEFEGEAIDAQRAVDQAYERRSEKHQLVIDLYIFSDLSAADAAKQADVSQDNVHQIAKRFRDDVDELLRGDGNTPD
jgi:RNA polymerase sigma factor (sigma-70 family)